MVASSSILRYRAKLGEIGADVDLRQLRYFCAVALSKSVSAAAEKLGISQPTLSQSIASIEAELGYPLLQRLPRGIILSPEGHVLLRHALSVCARFDECMVEMRELQKSVSGEVSLGIPSAVSMVLSVPLAETIALELPQVKFHIVEAMSGHVKEWVQSGAVELAILYDMTGLDVPDAVHLVDEELLFVSTPDSWPFDTPPGAPVPFDEVSKCGLVLPEKSQGLRTILDRAAMQQGQGLNVIMEMNSMNQIRSLVLRGSGFSILSASAVGDLIERGELLVSRVVGPELTRPVFLGSSVKRTQTRASFAVRQVAIAVARDLAVRQIWKAKLGPIPA